MELKDLFQVIKKRLWMIVVINIAVTAAAGYGLFHFMKPEFRASSNLVVNKVNEAAGGLISYDSIMAQRGLVSTYKKIIENPAIVNKVIEKYPDIGLEPSQLTDILEVSSEENTQIITLTVKDHSFDKAASIVNAVAKVFVEELPRIMKVDNVTILNEAQPAEGLKPVSMSPLVSTMLVWFVTLILLIGLANLIEYFDTTVKTERDIQRIFGHRQVALIPAYSKKDIQSESAKSSQNKNQTKALGQ